MMDSILGIYACLSFLVMNARGQTLSNKNYHAQCMSYGCSINDINSEINNIQGSIHQILSWNIEGEDVKNICSYLEQLNLKVITLQRATQDHINELKRTCLRQYNVSGVSSTSSKSNSNPIFYKNDPSQLTEIEEGTISGRKCKNLVWSRLAIYVSKPKRRFTKRSLSANLFAILSGKTMIRKSRNQSPSTHYQKKVLFVSIGNDLEEGSIWECLRDIYKHINGRRRYRTILSGLNGSNEKTVLSYPRPSRPVFKYCGPGKEDNKMCISNRGSRDTFQYRLTADIQTNTNNNPIFIGLSI